MKRTKNRSTLSMRAVVLTAIVSMTFVLLLGGCSSTQTTGEEVDDALITSKVKTKLAADPQVNPFEIDVDTLEGVVFLSGTVDTWDERMEAETLARETSGVLGVVNELDYGEPEPGAEQYFDDAEIVAKIEGRLALDTDVSPFDIDVDASDGVVTLRGTVKTVGNKREAEAIARNTGGVKSVRNQLSVE
ncbi:MAG: BON domain-containing protein [Thermoanaerobaculia bacterium]|nr:BON domain-containing protein [Thermoanaerobaculia bacterium]